MDSHPVPFRLRHRVTDGTTVLELHGELDAWADQDLHVRISALIDRPGTAVLVDLRPATFLDAGGLRLLVRIQRQVTRLHGTLHVLCDNPRQRQVLRLCNLDPLLDHRRSA
ncbi:STAS domain-containing protein [Streptomyces sp. NPDC018693]|uniref:STAS domain-containing protein n=1 Tax=unclassified Streptomyces TaxID=2593676 RepID=UPI00378D6CFB